MQERDADGILYPVGDQVHRVGAQHEKFRSGLLERESAAGEQVAGSLPIVGGLHGLDLGEVERIEQDAGGMMTSEPVPDALIGEAVPLE